MHTLSSTISVLVAKSCCLLLLESEIKILMRGLKLERAMPENETFLWPDEYDLWALKVIQVYKSLGNSLRYGIELYYGHIEIKHMGFHLVQWPWMTLKSQTHRKSCQWSRYLLEKVNVSHCHANNGVYSCSIVRIWPSTFQGHVLHKSR